MCGLMEWLVAWLIDNPRAAAALLVTSVVWNICIVIVMAFIQSQVDRIAKALKEYHYTFIGKV